MTHKIKTMKTAELFTREYGKDAYQAWLRREAEITELAKGGRYSRLEICHLREDSFRPQKEGEVQEVPAAVSDDAARYHLPAHQ